LRFSCASVSLSFYIFVSSLLALAHHDFKNISRKQSECASKMYATKAMEFDRLNKVNSSGSSLTPTKQQSLEELVS